MWCWRLTEWEDCVWVRPTERVEDGGKRMTEAMTGRRQVCIQHPEYQGSGTAREDLHRRW